ncbi:MAG TPA: phosphopentomutase [Methylomusa anaerophila]|uniref:Phosphopentomutase n=1 Tax=Methylomusa anaerophila TaxID=1930071 RepID=A0A348APE0_9FIRM|nr:phosphopentomutase [Methylomusa anaerophila]BBB92938.1 phosphopentomutase [Methylomusa anaerophila]HML87228.1 phosphopentomutase [Methylomusa anaerophila]
MFKRIIIIVLDSVGIGALPDAQEYGDEGTNTLVHIATARGRLNVPNLGSLGLGLIDSIAGVAENIIPKACYGKMAEISKGKDTTSGHWEIAGCPVFKPFPVYPEGFPLDVIQLFTKYTGLKVLGNKAASGTEIIFEYGEEHLRTGFPIVYTSADSVFQIAAHEDVIPLKRLYELCTITRTKVCIGQHAVGRIIARPFIGSSGHFVRTPNRHDYSLEPAGETMLDRLKDAGLSVIGVGKIGDIFAHRGLTESHPTKSNQDGMETTTILLNQTEKQKHNSLIMVNLVDFDSLYGHRNDVNGYAAALEQFDENLGQMLPYLKDDDLLIITADHGCDPTANGTDHTREYVPLLAYTPNLAYKNIAGKALGIRTSFADIAATILDNFHLTPLPYGSSFLHDIPG